MNRRSYLATAVAVALAGCTGSEEPDTGDDSSDDDGNRNDADASANSEPDSGDRDKDQNEDEEPLEVPADGETFDAFEEFWEWDEVAGTMYRVEEEPYVGSQSALLEGPEGESHVRIARRFDPPIDLTGLQPGLALATDHPADALIQLIDAEGNRIDCRHRPGGTTSLMRANFGIAGVDGEPDPSEIAEIRIGAWVGEEASARLWIDDLHFVSRPEPGRVLIHFDGGFESAYTDALPLLEEYGYPATVFVPTARVREETSHLGDRLAEEQLEELREAGWTVGSYAAHGYDVTERDDYDPETELPEAREWLEREGYDGAGYVAYPGGGYDDDVLALADERYQLGFAGGYPAQGRVTNPLCIPRVVEPDSGEATAALDRTAEFGGITILRYGDLGSASRDSLETALERLRELESDGDLEVASTADLETEFLA